VQALRDWAYGVEIGRFPLIAVVGFVTYGLILIGVVTMVARRWNKRFLRLAFRIHRWVGYAALAAATFHLLLGVSLYV
jgi:branched-subunit amino acid permease